MLNNMLRGSRNPTQQIVQHPVNILLKKKNRPVSSPENRASDSPQIWKYTRGVTSVDLSRYLPGNGWKELCDQHCVLYVQIVV